MQKIAKTNPKVDYCRTKMHFSCNLICFEMPSLHFGSICVKCFYFFNAVRTDALLVGGGTRIGHKPPPLQCTQYIATGIGRKSACTPGKIISALH